jgi:hypothetical protein
MCLTIFHLSALGDLLGVGVVIHKSRLLDARVDGCVGKYLGVHYLYETTIILNDFAGHRLRDNADPHGQRTT